MTRPSDARDSATALAPLVLLVVLLLLGSATFYSGPGPVSDAAGPSAARWGAVLAAIGRLLTLPLDSPSAADVRAPLFPLLVGLGACWAGARIRRRRMTPLPYVSASAPSGGVPRWFLALAAVVTLTASGSALRNGTSDYSVGWIVTFVTGASWAATLAVLVPPARVRGVMTALLAVAASVCILSLWHRQVTGLRYFLWPVGALTPLAALASLIAATAAAAVPAFLFRHRLNLTAPPAAGGVVTTPRSVGIVLFAVGTLVAAGPVLALAGRRAPLIGAVAAVALAAIFAFSLRGISRGGFQVVFALGLLGALGGTVWLRGQWTSTQREVSGPISVRVAYWRESLSLVTEAPLLGHGPDSFAALMTPRLALRRAEQPHVYHGSIDPQAHNEWLQAAVELGLPGAMAYLLIPLMAVFLACRSVRRGLAPDPPVILALAAGVVSVVISESASISLRGPILTPWYWTCIGLLLAATPRAAARPTSPIPPPSPPRPSAHLRASMFLALGLFLVIAATLDLSRIRAHAQARRAAVAGQPPPVALERFEAARGRFGFDNWLAVEAETARTALALAAWSAPRAASAPAAANPAWDDALSRCGALADRFFGLPGHAQLRADALLQAGERDAARAVIERYLDRVHPYDSAMNLVMAREFNVAPEERLQRLVRVAHSDALGTEAAALLERCFANADQVRTWYAAATSPDARPSVSRSPVDPHPLVEFWRVAALALYQQGDVRTALAWQRDAAEFYLATYETQSLFRRNHDAERDAWQRLAEMTFAVDAGEFANACDAVEWAERFALMGMAHESLRVETPNAEYFGDEVVPTAASESLRPLWRLSAKLRLAAGRERNLLFRILLSLPPERQTMADGELEKARLAGELVAQFEALPASRRPAHYEELRRMARGPH